MIRPVLHIGAPPPQFEHTDALWQEAGQLADAFAGDMVTIFPGRQPSRWIPRAFYGWSALSRLRALDTPGRIHHVLFSVPCAFPYLRRLKQPIVFSAMAGDEVHRLPAWMNERCVWVVGHERARARLLHAGARRVQVVRPGLDLGRLATTPPPPDGPFTLLCASAPWTPAQFASKGFDLYIEWLKVNTNARLILLWRGLHHGLLSRKLEASGLRDRVEVINEQVDIQPVLARCHAVILLARHAKLIKSWPHSLLEGLAAGRPIILNDAVAMSDYVEQHQLGVVMQGWNREALAKALHTVRSGDDPRAAAIRKQRVAEDFSPSAMLAAYQAAYQAANTP